MQRTYTVALAGNPNVGKSTIFNALTGLRQHTGNWPGKTVAQTSGRYTYQNHIFSLIDLPGTYSLLAHSPEEEITRDFLLQEKTDVTVIVLDATSLERNLYLALQIIKITPHVVICLNLMDEAEQKGLLINVKEMENLLQVPVIPTAALQKRGLERLKKTIFKMASGQIATAPQDSCPRIDCDSEAGDDQIAAHFFEQAEQIAVQVVHKQEYGRDMTKKLDDLFTSRLFGFPLMLLLLAFIFWLTITGANYPSQMLADFFFWAEAQLAALLFYVQTPAWLQGLLLEGIFRTLGWVVSVMLPPMAIFFPLFTILEDFGYLPRVAFNLDHVFKKACACGKQSLTICMGFGCNAAGVISCRIIDSPRERLLAILTNNFVPCNGRFPTMIALGTIFLAATDSWPQTLLLTFIIVSFILFGIFTTLCISRLLSHTILKGEPSSLLLELPPYRRPNIGGIIYRSLIDRTIFVLRRAVAAAAPAGAFLWLVSNITIDDTTVLYHMADFLQPAGRLIGLDGFILLAFILGLPANEIVMPVLIMTYLVTGQLTDLTDIQQLKNVLIDNGWTWATAISFMLFSLLHWPCATTLLTTYKETGSKKWTLAAFLLPTLTAFFVCFIFAQSVKIL